jgi:hypothetical protein
LADEISFTVSKHRMDYFALPIIGFCEYASLDSRNTLIRNVPNMLCSLLRRNDGSINVLTVHIEPPGHGGYRPSQIGLTPLGRTRLRISEPHILGEQEDE